MSFSTSFFTYNLVTNENLEDLRNLRNSAILAPYMAKDKYITKEKQLKWFNDMDKATNKYYLAFENEKKTLIGYVLIKNIDFNQKKGEPGTFLIDNNMMESSKAALFMITFLDYCYYKLGIKYFFGNVLKSNKRALGNYVFFQPNVVDDSGKEFHYEASIDYLKSTHKIRKALHLVFNYNPIFESEK
ncbi:MAG: hypothetical protein H6587_13095 [Flavobacteriales bacterium]|nr:hypothetical protein [Flavobacteriales bacterium]